MDEAVKRGQGGLPYGIQITKLLRRNKINLTNAFSENPNPVIKHTTLTLMRILIPGVTPDEIDEAMTEAEEVARTQEQTRSHEQQRQAPTTGSYEELVRDVRNLRTRLENLTTRFDTLSTGLDTLSTGFTTAESQRATDDTQMMELLVAQGQTQAEEHAEMLRTGCGYCGLYAQCGLDILLMDGYAMYGIIMDVQDGYPEGLYVYLVAYPLLKELQKLPLRIDVSTAVVSKAIKKTSERILNAFVDSVFQFSDQQLLPSQSNFAPVEEIGEAVTVKCIEGEIPIDFPEGIYMRNGPNPLFGALQSTVSVFGRSSNTWVEGEGMLHALYFNKDAQGNWNVSYKNRYVESDTLNIEKKRNRLTFLPALEGDFAAVLAAYLLNQLRFGKVNKDLGNTSIFEHGGKSYAVTENHLPLEVDPFSLKTLGSWDINGGWDRPFTSHAKVLYGTGELVIQGVDGRDPYFVVGVVTADGEKLAHKVNLKFKRSSYVHDIGVTGRYNIILDFLLIIDIDRVMKGGLIKYDKEGYSRIGVMRRYGDSYSVKWFDVKPHCTFHLLNCFEDGDEVVVRGCRAHGSVIPGLDFGQNKFEWFSKGYKPIATSEENSDHFTKDGFLFSRLYEWRLNMETWVVKERNLTGTEFSMDFPMVNNNFTGLHNKYGYAQLVDSIASSSCGLSKYGGLAKLHLDEQDNKISMEENNSRELIKVDYHTFEENEFCSGAAFVPRNGALEEDDGWIIAFVHNEDDNTSQVHIIDTKKFHGHTTAKIALPQRVSYGFHSTFILKPTQRQQVFFFQVVCSCGWKD
ncbi:carotenoid 9,10(9',10')-cleavage dioxygenase 1-like [Tasmannia lanceolata]|uniref:carotenoid 9,10(9',10')-cleavage dioxygenase 1-like n=1 Tax=Tasmannia lanceolata TaxID=3420 RepID=UPI00406442AB